LWAARFFKTRQLACEAVNGGKVHVNGQRCKPGKEVKVGDLITITKALYSWEINVITLNKQRRPAKEAVQLYSEEAASINKRLALMEQHKLQAQFSPGEREHKPNKKQRRQIHRFKQDSI
jgi:ribosome-associated heat shock protein Hsp15